MAASVTAPTDATTPAPMSRRKVLEALSGLLLGMFVSMLAATVVSTSLPVIVHDLDGDQTVFTWVVTATLLTTAISTPIWGKLADLFDRKLLIQLALALFVLATAAAGFSQDPGTLIAFRAVQGLGAGGLAALSQVLMADIISPRERGRYMGLFGAVMALATVGGPLLGGFITDGIGWRWNFFVAIPFAIAAFVILQRTLHVPRIRRGKVSIDYVGIVLLSTAVSLLLVWITNAGKNYDWWSVETGLSVGGVVVATALFIVVELRSREPLIPLSLFRNRTFTLSVVASIATGLAMFGAAVFLGQYMQMSRGATPAEAGILTIPMMGGLLVTSILIGQLISRFGHWKPYMIGGAVALIAGSVLLSTLHYDTPYPLVALYMFLLGAGVGATMQNLVLVVQNTAKPEEMGAASSGVTFFRSLGGTIGVSVMGAALAASVTDGFLRYRDAIGAALAPLGEQGLAVAAQLKSGTLPAVHTLPDGVRVIVEDIYAQGIAHSFLFAVPLAIISLIAILFMPNRPLTRMTTTERLAAGEADLAMFTASEGMESIPASGSTSTGPADIVESTGAESPTAPSDAKGTGER